MADNDLRVIVIGLDGATWDLIKPWAYEGKLPTFKVIMDNSARGTLESTLPPLSPSAWSSIFTGVTPAKHSVWGFVKQKKDSYFIRPITSKDIKEKLLWDYLTENGLKGIFFNIPFVYPPKKINGILTTGLGTPSKNSNFAYPPEVKHEIREKFPDYDVDFNEDEILRFGNKRSISEKILKITKAHMDAFKFYYKKEKAYVYSVVIRSLDVVQHYFWDDLDTLFQFYNQADDFLAWILANKKREDILVICSDHGFRGINKNFYINDFLKKEGLLNVEKNAIGRKIRPSAEAMHKVLIKLQLRKLIWEIKHSKHLEQLLKIFPSEKIPANMIKWNETKAYYQEGSEGIIKINVKDRDPEGVVDLKDYDEVRGTIIKKILEFRDPKNGEKVIEFAKRGEEIYSNGEYIPDIIVYPKEGYKLAWGFSKSGSAVEKERERNGEHAIDGIIALYGISVKNTEIKAKVYDVTPTILWALGLAHNSNSFDGMVIEEAFKEEMIPVKVDTRRHESIRDLTSKAILNLRKEGKI